MRHARLMLTAALCAGSCLLTACATRSPPPPDPEPVAQPRPRACSPGLLAPLKPEPPVQGAIVQPETADERAATGAFLTGEAEARAWGREGWRRAGEAREDCLARQGPP